MKKRIQILCVAVVVLGTLLVSWSRIVSVRTRNRLAALITAGADHISLSGVASFPWDNVLIFSPYSDRKLVSRELGYFFPIENQNEGHALLVFTKKAIVVSWIRVPRMTSGDFASIPRSNADRHRFCRKETEFTVDYRGEEKHPVMTLDKMANQTNGH